MVNKLLFSLILSLFLSFPVFSQENQGTLDEIQCMQFGSFAANVSLAVSQGATAKDLLAYFDNDKFRQNPPDIQRLVIVLIQFLTSVGKGNTPEEDFTGAMDFCIAGGGDVAKLTKSLEKALGISSI